MLQSLSCDNQTKQQSIIFCRNLSANKDGCDLNCGINLPCLAKQLSSVCVHFIAFAFPHIWGGIFLWWIFDVDGSTTVTLHSQCRHHIDQPWYAVISRMFTLITSHVILENCEGCRLQEYTYANSRIIRMLFAGKFSLSYALFRISIFWTAWGDKIFFRIASIHHNSCVSLQSNVPQLPSITLNKVFSCWTPAAPAYRIIKPGNLYREHHELLLWCLGFGRTTPDPVQIAKILNAPLSSHLQTVSPWIAALWSEIQLLHEVAWKNRTQPSTIQLPSPNRNHEPRLTQLQNPDTRRRVHSLFCVFQCHGVRFSCNPQEQPSIPSHPTPPSSSQTQPWTSKLPSRCPAPEPRPPDPAARDRAKEQPSVPNLPTLVTTPTCQPHTPPTHRALGNFRACFSVFCSVTEWDPTARGCAEEQRR